MRQLRLHCNRRVLPQRTMQGHGLQNEVHMLQLGKVQVLEVIKQTPFGVYLGKEGEQVLLPGSQVPHGTEVGDSLEVFLYKDSEDRIIATVNRPVVMLGEVALLQVSQVNKVGAFLNWGLEKDLFLPYKEMTAPVSEGDQVLTAVYIDKSGRLCGTMKVYPYLSTESPYTKENQVTGRVYELSKDFGVYVAVDDCYSARIPAKQLYGETKPQVGDVIRARVTAVKADGKLDLSVREKAHVQMDKDAAKLTELLKENGGILPVTEKSSPEDIKEATGMSKNEFKRAVGRLYKERRVLIEDGVIRSV